VRKIAPYAVPRTSASRGDFAHPTALAHALTAAYRTQLTYTAVQHDRRPYDENDPVAKARVSASTQALADLGWTDGRNVGMDVRWAGPDINRIRALAQNLVGLQPTSSWQTQPLRPLPSSGRRGRSRSARPHGQPLRGL
jgi:hypothetical protein